MGSNMAEAHPVGFQWVMEAKARGTRIVHIDPRFTRTSAVADRHVPLRAGSDIAFLGGVINYILTNELDFREYVAAYTNASYLIDESFRDTEDLDGLFSGYDDETASYDPSSWHYESTSPVGRAGAKERAAPDQHGSGGAPIEGGAGDIPADPTLQHPRCVYQMLKRHYARYTPEMVERVCGVPADQFLEVARAWAENSGRERTTALVYSVGWTQHSVGAQYIRAGAIIQLLLGNMGRPAEA
jgi:formate dehydrogenase major subunit